MEINTEKPAEERNVWKIWRVLKQRCLKVVEDSKVPQRASYLGHIIVEEEETLAASCGFLSTFNSECN